MITVFQSRPNLRTLITPPIVWSVHFLFSYVAAAVYCAKAGEPLAGLGPVQLAVGGATALALALIGAAGWQAVRHWRLGVAAPPHNEDTPEGRDRFLGFATLLLCGVSFVGVVFVALPALLIGDCR